MGDVGALGSFSTSKTTLPLPGAGVRAGRAAQCGGPLIWLPAGLGAIRGEGRAKTLCGGEALGFSPPGLKAKPGAGETSLQKRGVAWLWSDLWLEEGLASLTVP